MSLFEWNSRTLAHVSVVGACSWGSTEREKEGEVCEYHKKPIIAPPQLGKWSFYFIRTLSWPAIAIWHC